MNKPLTFLVTCLGASRLVLIPSSESIVIITDVRLSRLLWSEKKSIRWLLSQFLFAYKIWSVTNVINDNVNFKGWLLNVLQIKQGICDARHRRITIIAVQAFLFTFQRHGCIPPAFFPPVTPCGSSQPWQKLTRRWPSSSPSPPMGSICSCVTRPSGRSTSPDSTPGRRGSSASRWETRRAWPVDRKSVV